MGPLLCCLPCGALAALTRPGCSLLHDAAEAGDEEGLRQLLAPPAEARPPLCGMRAPASPGHLTSRPCAQGQPSRHAASLNERDRDGCTPLHLAVLGGVQPAVSASHAPARSRSLMARAGHLECVKAILEAGARVSIGLESSSSLHMATCTGCFAAKEAAAAAISAVLLARGSGPYSRRVGSCPTTSPRNACCPAHLACWSRDDLGRTPLHWAALHGLVSQARLLLDAGRATAGEPYGGSLQRPALEQALLPQLGTR